MRVGRTSAVGTCGICNTGTGDGCDGGCEGHEGPATARPGEVFGLIMILTPPVRPSRGREEVLLAVDEVDARFPGEEDESLLSLGSPEGAPLQDPLGTMGESMTWVRTPSSSTICCTKLPDGTCIGMGSGGPLLRINRTVAGPIMIRK